MKPAQDRTEYEPCGRNTSLSVRQPSSSLAMARTRIPVFCGVALLVLLAGLVSVHAADWSFDPVINTGVELTDNVFSLGSSNATGSFDPEDTSYFLSVGLVWTAETPRSLFSFSYTPFVERYADFSSLDNTAHRVALTWHYQTSSRIDWDAGARWSRQQRQRVVFDDPAQDQVVLPQTEFDSLGAQLQGRFVLSERSRIVALAGLGGSSYAENEIPGEDLDGDGTIDIPGVFLEDTDNLFAQVGWETDLSPRSVAGISTYVSRIDEGRRGEYDVYRLLGVLQWGTEERVMTTFTLGGATTSVRRLADGADEALVDEPSFMVGTLGVEGTIFARTSLRGGVFRDVMSSGGTTGTALSTGAFVSMSIPVGRWSTVGLFARYANRDPVDVEQAALETDTTALRAEWALAISSRWYLVLAGERFDQSSAQATLDGEYNVLSAGLRWTPTAARR